MDFSILPENTISFFFLKRMETPALAESKRSEARGLVSALSESSESAFRKKDGISIFY